MVVHPLESAGTRRRSMRSAIPSIALHGALLFLAVRATAHAALVPDPPERTGPTVFLPPGDPVPTERARTRQMRTHPDVRPLSRPTVTIPTFREGAITPPTIGPDVSALPLGDFRSGGLSPAAGIGVDARGIGAAPLSVHQVDRQAEPLGGGAAPVYPEALRSRAVSGTVVAEFVVDTTGRIEPTSFRALRSDDPMFTESVRAALLRTRFR
ncbi:MAG TPA: energy transducer TonB, partial [Candidatus Elarobacter sp.]|nr:energy transducer TonB [Candidatus Elarobacter sp.]